MDEVGLMLAWALAPLMHRANVGVEIVERTPAVTFRHRLAGIPSWHAPLSSQPQMERDKSRCDDGES